MVDNSDGDGQDEGIKFSVVGRRGEYFDTLARSLKAFLRAEGIARLTRSRDFFSVLGLETVSIDRPSRGLTRKKILD
jgi:hypothetical protein